MNVHCPAVSPHIPGNILSIFLLKNKLPPPPLLVSLPLWQHEGNFYAIIAAEK